MIPELLETRVPTLRRKPCGIVAGSKSGRVEPSKASGMLAFILLGISLALAQYFLTMSPFLPFGMVICMYMYTYTYTLQTF